TRSGPLTVQALRQPPAVVKTCPDCEQTFKDTHRRCPAKVDEAMSCERCGGECQGHVDPDPAPGVESPGLEPELALTPESGPVTGPEPDTEPPAPAPKPKKTRRSKKDGGK
ncbi:hypothetical protein LCGC14_3067500, partial [marine sediment metagenome]